MKRVFLDTNIMLDLAAQREHYDEAISILHGAYEDKFQICASVLSYANIAYILRKLPKDRLYRLLDLLREDIPMVAISPADVNYAIDHPTRDFEDTLQYFCAKTAGCDTIVTSNTKDFSEFHDISILTPEQFVVSEELR